MQSRFRRALTLVAGVAVISLALPTAVARAATTTVTITATTKAITYGDAEPQFTYSVSGLAAGDSLTTQPTCTVAGPHRNASIYAIACSGAAANPSKYTIKYAVGYLYVYKAAVFVYGNYAYKYYGYDDPKINYTVSGLKYDDKFITAPTCTLPAEHSAVGKYTISCTGADAGANYTVSYPTNSTSTLLQVFPAPLYVYGNYAQKSYGAADPKLTYSTQGLRNDDKLLTEPSCTVPADHKDAGNYPITCTGADAGPNYQLSYVTNAATVLRVLPAQLYVYGNYAAKYYGTDDPAITYTVQGLKNGDTLTTPPTCTVDDQHRDAGNYPITCSGADAGANYSIGYLKGATTVLQVVPAPLYIGGNFTQQAYGAADAKLTYSVQGLKNGDTLKTAPTCTVPAEHKVAGDYPITCTGADAGPNYQVVYVENAATVLRVLPSRIYIGGTFVQAYYGYGDPAIKATVLGLQNGDTLVTEPTCTVPADHRNVGDYAITCTGADAGPNYQITYVSNTATVLRVLPAPLAVGPYNQYRFYGSPDPTFTWTSVGLRYDDKVTTAPTCGVADEHEHAGTYEITCTGADAGPNYLIGYTKATLTVVRTASAISAEPVVIRKGPLGLPILGNGKMIATLYAAIPYPKLSVLPGQRVTFTAGDTTICSAVTDAKGVASCYPGLTTLTLLTSGTFTATWAGNADIAGTTTSANTLA